MSCVKIRLTQLMKTLTLLNQKGLKFGRLIKGENDQGIELRMISKAIVK